MQMDALLDYVRPDCPSCPRAFALDKIRLAAREFFSRSAIWRQYLSPKINIVATTRRYTLSVDAGLEADVTGIAQAWYRGRKIFLRSPQQLNEMYSDLDAATGEPYYYNLPAINAIEVFPNPIVSYTAALNVWCVLAPKTDSDYLRDEDNAWKEVIAHGAKAMLMRVGGKPYTSLEAAMKVHQPMFDRGISSARAWFENGAGDFTGGEIVTSFDR